MARRTKKTSFSTKNFKEAYSFSGQELMFLGIAMLWWTASPTLFKLNSWIGFLVAYGVPATVAGFMKQKILAGATVAVAVTHALRKFGNDWIAGDVDYNDGKGVWELEDMPMLANSTYGRLPSGASLAKINGETVAVYPSSSMNDYFEAGQEIAFPRLNDYITSADEVSFKNNFQTNFQERI